MTHLDLFSGIGGFALAAQWAGFKTVAFSEIEPYACKILAKHWPKVPNLGDLRTADFGSVGPIDVLTGGFPCQPFSVAGKRKGKRDDRDLWPAMFGVIEKTRPAWIIGENVAGFVRMELARSIAEGERCGEAREHSQRSAKRITISGEIPADSTSERLSGQGMREAPIDSADDQAWKNDESINGRGPAIWLPEPAVGRVANGIPNRAHRLRGLGNAIVPQVAEVILKAIAEIITQTQLELP